VGFSAPQPERSPTPTIKVKNMLYRITIIKILGVGPVSESVLPKSKMARSETLLLKLVTSNLNHFTAVLGQNTDLSWQLNSFPYISSLNGSFVKYIN
jgi:hypothetical protein